MDQISAAPSDQYRAPHTQYGRARSGVPVLRDPRIHSERQRNLSGRGKDFPPHETRLKMQFDVPFNCSKRRRPTSGRPDQLRPGRHDDAAISPCGDSIASLCWGTSPCRRWTATPKFDGSSSSNIVEAVDDSALWRWMRAVIAGSRRRSMIELKNPYDMARSYPAREGRAMRGALVELHGFRFLPVHEQRCACLDGFIHQVPVSAQSPFLRWTFDTFCRVCAARTSGRRRGREAGLGDETASPYDDDWLGFADVSGLRSSAPHRLVAQLH